jgi:hypothetical protein
MTPAAASAAATFPLRTCFIYDERTPQKVFAVQGCNSLFGFRVIFYLGEAESAGLSRKTIAKQCERIGLYADFGKQRPDLLFRSFEREIAHVQFLHDRSPCAPVVHVSARLRAGEAANTPIPSSILLQLPSAVNLSPALRDLDASIV